MLWKQTVTIAQTIKGHSLAQTIKGHSLELDSDLFEAPGDDLYEALNKFEKKI
jgi:Protein of unknown function (DUF1493)